MDKDDLINYLNKKRNDITGDPDTCHAEYAIANKTYQTIIDIISRYETTLRRLSEPETYEVDYNCPNRNSFIESVERSL